MLIEIKTTVQDQYLNIKKKYLNQTLLLTE